MKQKIMAWKTRYVTKWRLLWLLIAAAWLFVFLKLLVGGVFEKHTSLVAAFSVTNPQEISATVEVTAKYPSGELGDKEKLRLLEKVAGTIGLTLDAEPETVKTEQRQEVSFHKKALAAETTLKTISLVKTGGNREGTDTTDAVTVIATAGEQETTYLYAKICLNQSLDAVLSYKALLERVLGELDCTEISTTIQLVGDYGGYLTLERKNEITEEILEALEAEVVYEYREQELYTVYAYTAALENYITVENKKINLHIAMSQDEEHYRTTLYLASPILPDTW